MRDFILKRPGKVLDNKQILEKKLNVKLEITGRKGTMNGEEIDEFITSKVIEALEIGFDIDTSILLANQDYVFEKIEIKNLTKRKNLKEVRGRLIGQQGRTKELIEELSECYISVHDNEVGIIGPVENIKNAMQAVSKIIQGSKQSSVYAYLEKQRKIQHPGDLGLKINGEE